MMPTRMKVEMIAARPGAVFESSVSSLTLTPESLVGRVTVEPAEVKKQYDDNVRQYTKAEQRQASHILIAVKPDATDAELTWDELPALRVDPTDGAAAWLAATGPTSRRGP